MKYLLVDWTFYKSIICHSNLHYPKSKIVTDKKIIIQIALRIFWDILTEIMDIFSKEETIFFM